ncbi:hypothetical protein ZOSMA_18G00430 [Zostera marina]|uniref:BHLH domain-containing protein n=1 Tax=Zostera marina TaxID=29655 RepID=A0A0K9PRV2_ZOSMR|nr:hypothetical protein ZOSMA_18G00430 [Zostera marina]
MVRRNNRRRGNGGGVKLSTDPQSVAARERRHRISDRFKILRSLVPGGSKMDTVSMLEEAIHYVKFLKMQISIHQALMMNLPDEHFCTPPTPVLLPVSNLQISTIDNSLAAAFNTTYSSSSVVLPTDYSSLPPLPNQDCPWPFQQEDEIFFPQPLSANFYHPSINP